jgi:hypothetical protein
MRLAIADPAGSLDGQDGPDAAGGTASASFVDAQLAAQP